MPQDKFEHEEPVALDGVKCIRATERALLCVIDGAEVWVPQSQVDGDSEVYAMGHAGKLVISGWFAKKQGLV